MEERWRVYIEEERGRDGERVYMMQESGRGRGLHDGGEGEGGVYMMEERGREGEGST